MAGLSGLVSGVDTASLVEQLMQLERQGQTRTQFRQKQTYAQSSGLGDIKTKLATLKSAAAALRDAGTWTEGQSVTSADAARVGVTRTGGATATTLTLDDNDGATPAVKVDIGPNAKIADVAAAINGKSGSPVYAAV